MSLLRTPRLLFTVRPSVAGTARVPGVIRYKTTTADRSTDDAAVTPRQTTATSTAHEEMSQVTDAGAATRGAVSETPMDSATSAYSPTPSFPEGRTPDEPLAASVISGAPLELQSRTARIYQPSKPATQSGNWNQRQWRIDWDVLPRGHRWENPLMGWQSSGDPLQGTHIFFKSKEDAIHFAEKQGFDWFVQEPNVREFRSKSYAANFVHSPKRLKIIRTK